MLAGELRRARGWLFQGFWFVWLVVAGGASLAPVWALHLAGLRVSYSNSVRRGSLISSGSLGGFNDYPRRSWTAVCTGWWLGPTTYWSLEKVSSGHCSRTTASPKRSTAVEPNQTRIHSPAIVVYKMQYCIIRLAMVVQSCYSYVASNSSHLDTDSNAVKVGSVDGVLARLASYYLR